MRDCQDVCLCKGSFGCFSRGLSREESRLLNEPLPVDLTGSELNETWVRYQDVIGQLLLRMGRESPRLDAMARVVLVRNLGGIRARIALIPTLGRSAQNVVEKHGLSELALRLAGEFSLMELSAAAGYRTFCFPDLVRGLLKTGKMEGQSVRRMIDTFEFLKTMCQQPLTDPRVTAQLDRTNHLHGKYKVAGAHNQRALDLFKYIALNMFYIGPGMRPDLSVAERHALCGLTVLVAGRMGHRIEGSVRDLEEFIVDYEANSMFELEDAGSNSLRRKAVQIARASRVALGEIPTISPARIHGYVPHRVKQLLELEDLV